MKKRDNDPRVLARMEEARRWFRDHHARVEPDAAFAARVAARLRREPARDLGWAAARLLPASVVLAVLLAWAAALSTDSRQETSAAHSETDALTWLMGVTETTR